MKKAGIWRLIFINLVVLLGIFLTSLFLVVIVGAVYDFAKPLVKAADFRANSPAYSTDEEKNRARQFFVDAKKGKRSYRPFEGWRQRSSSTPTVNIDNNGYRTHKSGTDNKPGARTVGFFGGSNMWGVGADDERTIPAYFDTLTTEFDVTNYSERGFTSRQSLALLINLINQGKAPEIVVFYDGFNDVWTHCNYAVTTSLNSHQLEPMVRGMFNQKRDQGIFTRTLVSPFLEVFGKFKRKRVQPDKLACSGDEKRARQVADTTFKNWEIANSLVKEFGGRFFAFLQPNFYVGTPRKDHVVLKRKQIGRGKEQRIVYPFLRENIAKSGSGWAFDISRVFDRAEPIYIDDAHVAPPGNKIVAETIRDIIANNR